MESGRKGDSSLSEFPEKKLNSTVPLLPLPARPRGNKLFHDLTPLAKKENQVNEAKKEVPPPLETFHQIDKFTETNPTEIRTYFLKRKRTKSDTPSLEPTMYELEAVCAAFYKLLAPHHTPTTHAVYDEEKQEYAGVASEEIPGFRSIAMDPLKEEDLNVDFLDKTNLSIAEIDEMDEALQKLEEKMESFERRKKKLESTEGVHAASLKELTDSLKREEAEVTKQIIDFFVNAEINNSLTRRNLETYRIIKGLAITLTTSYIFCEDDLHQNNLSKYGKRIDFDMSLWPITYSFKTIMPVQFLEVFKFRKRNIDSFVVTRDDIEKFPSIKDSQPFYWPTKNLGTSSHSIPTMVKYAFGYTTNPYPYPINLLFQKLEKNRIFVYHQFRTLAKFILSDSNMYKQIVAQHLRKECFYNSKLLIDIITKEVEDRIAIFENTLLSIPEFANYLQQHGKKIIDELCDSASEQAINFDKDQMTQTYKDFVNIILLKSQRREHDKTATLKPAPDVPKEVNTYKNITEELKKSMNSYKNPGAIGAWGLFRSRDNFYTATELTKFAEKQTPKSPTDNFVAIRALKDKITSVRGNLKAGGEMHRQLTDLLTMINKSLPEKSPSGSPRKLA